MTDSRFKELDHVKATFPEGFCADGYVIDSLWKDGRWLYKVSCEDPDAVGESFDNWIAEEWLSLFGLKES